MSNRQERRKRLTNVSGRPTLIEGTGIQEVPESLKIRFPQMILGEHLWVMVGMWKIHNPEEATNPSVKKYLDLENLLSLEGPGCFWCEQVWSKEIADRECPGEPRN